MIDHPIVQYFCFDKLPIRQDALLPQVHVQAESTKYSAYFLEAQASKPYHVQLSLVLGQRSITHLQLQRINANRVHEGIVKEVARTLDRIAIAHELTSISSTPQLCEYADIFHRFGYQKLQKNKLTRKMKSNEFVLYKEW
jgi:hypothetical protein